MPIAEYNPQRFKTLAYKIIFGTDWPGVPGLRKNALALFDPGLDPETVELILRENAERVSKLDG